MSWCALVSLVALVAVLYVLNVQCTHDEDIRELELRALLRNIAHKRTLSLDTNDNDEFQEDLETSKRRRRKNKPKKFRKWQQKLLKRKRKACERACFRGQCRATEDDDVSCVCYEDWIGSNCDIRITEPPATQMTRTFMETSSEEETGSGFSQPTGNTEPPTTQMTTVVEASSEESEETEETTVCNKSTCQHGIFVQSACVCDGEWSGLNCNKYAPCLGANATGQYFYPHSKANCYIQCSQFGESFVNCCAEGLIWSQQILGCIRNTTVITGNSEDNENAEEDLELVGIDQMEEVIKEIEEIIQDIEEENGGPTDETIAAQNSIDSMEEEINEIEEENPEPETDDVTSVETETEGMTEDEIKDQIEEEIEQEIEDEIESETGSEIDDETKVEIEQEIEHQIEDEIKNKTLEELEIEEEILLTGTEDEMEQEIESEIEQEIEDEADGPIDEQTKQEIEDEIKEILVDVMTSEDNSTETEAEFENENEVDVEEQLSEEIDEQTGGNIDNKTKQEIEDEIEEIIEELEPEPESEETEIEIDNGGDSAVIDESEEVVFNETDIITSPPTTTAVIQLRCPLASKHGGALHIYNDTCYKFVEVERSWNEAATDCVSQGGQLVKVLDQKHNDWIVETAVNALGWKFNGVWIGARDEDNEWMWSQGEPLEYANWARRYPRRWSGKCANIRFDKQGKWENKRCEHPLRAWLPYDYTYICEYEMESFTQPTGGIPETTTQSAEVTTIPDNFDYLCDESNGLYHSHPSRDDEFIQCDNWGQATVMGCAPGTKWKQSELTCVDKRFEKKSAKRNLLNADARSTLKRILAKLH